MKKAERSGGNVASYVDDRTGAARPSGFERT